MATDKLEGIYSGDGYCKLPDGTLIQWGSISLSNFTQANPYILIAEILFPLPFLNSNVKVIPTLALSENTGAEISTNCKYRSTYSNGTGGTVSIQNGSGQITDSQYMSLDWIAIGRWK